MSKEDIYLRTPTFLQNIIVSMEGLRIKRTRYNNAFFMCLSEYKERESWPYEKMVEYRNQRQVSFINHAISNVPYYRKLSKEIGFGTVTLDSLEEFLAGMPILSKAFVQDKIEDLYAENMPASTSTISHTSGTTGAGLRFRTMKEAANEQWAVWWRYRNWHGIDMDTLHGLLGGRAIVPPSQEKPPFWRFNIPGHQILFSSFHMNRNNIPFFIQEISKRELTWLHGYPSALFLLANYLLEEGIEPPKCIRWITTGAENLLKQQYQGIKEAFRIGPIQHYGLSEATANASECINGKLHVDEDFSYVEFIPTSNEAGYRIVGTNFTNPATPLLRYDTGDIATLSSEGCGCGNHGRIIQSIDGRKEDYILLKNGVKVGRLDHIFKDLMNIREAQIYQEEAGKIQIRIVKGKNYGSMDEQILLKETRNRLGKDIEIDLDYINEIEKSRAGKLRLVVSNIREGQL